MKKMIFLLAFVGCFLTSMDAQTRYGASTYPLDTASATETINYYLPGSYGDDRIDQLATWQVRMTRIADTLTVTIYLEESIDDATSSPDYVTVSTIASAVVLNATTTELKYLYHAPIRGKKQRLRLVSSGSAASAQIEVDAWIREKVPLMVTDEF
jgi:hypothetical protein